MAADPPPRSHLLPNHHLAYVPPEKLRDYALDPSHPSGRHKARVFEAVLGFRQAQWETLRDALLAALPTTPATLTRETPGGTGYEVIAGITGPNGTTAHVLTAWVVPDSSDPHSEPRLVSAYVRR